MSSIEILPAPPQSTRRLTSRAIYPAAKVLLAEDDPELRAMIAAALRGDGYDVDEVHDGGRLLVRLADAHRTGDDPRAAYDVIVSDVRMPVCSGIQILEGLRRAHWPTPVLLMTAFGDPSTRQKVESLGAVLMDKPFDVDDLRTAVLHLVRHRAATGRSSRGGRR
jgi:DNA-binding response OmpR family regulator